MSHRTLKQQVVWDQMLELERAQLGQREVVSAQRDKFVLTPDHGAASVLSRRPEADGFIRGDRDSLLFRDASDALRSQLETVKPGAAMDSDKGFEVRWTAVDASDIVRMFDVVRSMASRITGPSE